MGYYLALSFFSFFSFMSSFFIKYRKYTNFILIYSFIILVAFASLRWEVGTDWNAYYNFYKYGDYPNEVGYALINNLFSGLEINYNMFIFFINSIIIFFLIKFLKSYSYLPIIGILIFYSDLFLYLNLSGIRQGIALSIVLYSFHYACNKNLKIFFLLVVVAASFHISAVIGLMIYFIPHNKFNIKKLIGFVLVLIPIAFYFDDFIYYFDMLTSKSLYYYVFQQEVSQNIYKDYLVGVIRRVIPLMFIVLFYKEYFKMDHAHYYLNIYIIGFIIYLISYNISPDIGVRISLYFTIFELLIVSNLVYILKRNFNKILIITSYLFICLYKITGYASYNLYTYKTILFY